VTLVFDGRDADTGQHHVRLSLPASPDSVAECRHEVLRSLRLWGAPVDLDTIELLLSEIVTNAILYGAAPEAPAARVLVEVEENPDGIVVRVHDTGAGFQKLAVGGEPSGLMESGRGLFLVKELSDDWSYDSGPRGTSVYFLVRYLDVAASDPAAKASLRKIDEHGRADNPRQVSRQCDSHTTDARLRSSRSVRSTQPAKSSQSTTKPAAESASVAEAYLAQWLSPAQRRSGYTSMNLLSSTQAQQTRSCCSRSQYPSPARPCHGGRAVFGCGVAAKPEPSHLALRHNDPRCGSSRRCRRHPLYLGHRPRRIPGERIPALISGGRGRQTYQANTEPTGSQT
jgi:anti-sigma regulatory factor (Ser/Thr protein kinase)